MQRRRLPALGLAAVLIVPLPLVLAGCGNASNIEVGLPSNIEPPKDFDPGGGVKPDMKGKRAPSPVP
ncbi:hypothetical protein [Paludisphaera rhizosphaerae]|uniref:hypothetical protein n=1 Tax=Paludisphaera rhizosphaerae TaxID=2711216 RepID=UPI0013ED718B|nr:hypothetical protein [Paludisphaera rhizosphaerae]